MKRHPVLLCLLLALSCNAGNPDCNVRFIKAEESRLSQEKSWNSNHISNNKQKVNYTYDGSTLKTTVYLRIAGACNEAAILPHYEHVNNTIHLGYSLKSPGDYCESIELVELSYTIQASKFDSVIFVMPENK